ncbi:MAG: hypothetical protein AABY22_08735 [Nanoarchaeota archaeon]
MTKRNWKKYKKLGSDLAYINKNENIIISINRVRQIRGGKEKGNFEIQVDVAPKWETTEIIYTKTYTSALREVKKFMKKYNVY